MAANVLWQPRWIMVGDSIQAWVVDDYNSTPPLAKNLTASRVPQLTNTTIQNASCPGAALTTNPAGLADAVINQVGYFGVNGVLLMLGTNDWIAQTVNTSDYFMAICAFVDKFKAKNIPVVVVSPLWRTDAYAQKPQRGGATCDLTSYVNTAAWVVSLYGSPLVHYVDGFNSPCRDASYFADGVHLNNKGHIAFGDYLIAQMKAKGFW